MRLTAAKPTQILRLSFACSEFKRDEITTLEAWENVPNKKGAYKVNSEFVTKGHLQDDFKWREGQGNSGCPGGFLFRPNQFAGTEFSIHPFQIDDLVECTYNTVAGGATTGLGENLQQMAIFKWRRADIQGVVTVLNYKEQLTFTAEGHSQTQWKKLPADQQVLKYTYKPIGHDWKRDSFTKNISATTIEFQRSIDNAINMSLSIYVS